MMHQWLTAFVGVFFFVASGFSQASGQIGGRSQITGLVRYGKSNAPAENVQVRLEAYIGGHIADVQTDRSGKFAFTGLGREEYDLIVTAAGYQPTKEHVDLQTVLTAFVQIQLLPEAHSRDTNAGTSNVRISDSARKEYDKARSTLDKPQKVQETVSHLEKAIALSPGFADAQLLLGTVYMDARQWEKAEAPLQEALKTKPESVPTLLALGELYLHDQKYTEAEATLTRALGLDDNSFRGHLTLARVNFATGKLDKAGPEVDRAIHLNPDFPEAHLLAGNIRFKSRQADKALPFFETYLKLQPNGPYANETRELVAKIKKALGLP